MLGCYYLSSAASTEAMNTKETEDRFVRLGDPQRPGLCSCPFSVPSSCLGGPHLLVMQLPELPDHLSISITISRRLSKTANITSHFWTFEYIHSFYRCLLTPTMYLLWGSSREGRRRLFVLVQSCSQQRMSEQDMSP